MTFADEFHNYYEKLVLEYIESCGLIEQQESDYLADLCCIALNHLPPKYVRFDVDMAFFLGRAERIRMQLKVKKAVAEAKEFLDAEHHAEHHPHSKT